MNLAQLKPQEVSQGEQIGRRASIVPENRNTRAPAFEPSGNMRSARRGGGGAAELMRSLAIAQRGLDDLQESALNMHAAREAENIAEGAAGQQLGTVDPVMVEKSEGYRNAVTKGRTMSDFNASARAFDEELRGVIEHQDSPDLAVRQADVRQRMEAFYHGLAIDAETKQLRPNLQSPGAMRYLADAISRSRPTVEAAALARIEARFNGEAVTHFQRNIDDQSWLNGASRIDLPLALSVLPKTVPIEMVKEAAVSAFVGTAAKLADGPDGVEGVRLLDAITGKPKVIEPGVPRAPSDFPEAIDPVTRYELSDEVPAMAGVNALQLSADDVIRLRNTRDELARRLRVRWRAKVEEDQGNNASGMALRLWGQGNPLTTTEIREAIRTGAIDPQQGIGLHSMANSMANQRQAQQDRALSLADRAEARTREQQTAAITGSFYRRILSGELTAPQARSEALRMLPTIRDPKVQAAVGNAVLGAAGDLEQLVTNSAPVRAAAREFSKFAENAERDIMAWPGMTLSRASSLTPRYRQIVDAGLADYLARVRDGEGPAAAKASVARDISSRLNSLKPTVRR